MGNDGGMSDIAVSADMARVSFGGENDVSFQNALSQMAHKDNVFPSTF